MREYPGWMIRTSIRLNETTGGPKGWTMCARYWSWKLNGKWYGKVSVYGTDLFFKTFFNDEKHCHRSYVLRNVKL